MRSGQLKSRQFGAGSRVSSKMQSQLQRLTAVKFGAGSRISSKLQSQLQMLRAESALELALESAPKYSQLQNTKSAPDAQGRVSFGAGCRVSSKIQSQLHMLRAELALELALESAPNYRVSSKGSGQSQLWSWL